jgi:hypothetical protein
MKKTKKKKENFFEVEKMLEKNAPQFFSATHENSLFPHLAEGTRRQRDRQSRELAANGVSRRHSPPPISAPRAKLAGQEREIGDASCRQF